MVKGLPCWTEYEARIKSMARFLSTKDAIERLQRTCAVGALEIVGKTLTRVRSYPAWCWGSMIATIEDLLLNEFAMTHIWSEQAYLNAIDTKDEVFDAPDAAQQARMNMLKDIANVSKVVLFVC